MNPRDEQARRLRGSQIATAESALRRRGGYEWSEEKFKITPHPRIQEVRTSTIEYERAKLDMDPELFNRFIWAGR